MASSTPDTSRIFRKSQTPGVLSPDERLVLRGFTYGLDAVIIARGLGSTPSEVGITIASVYQNIHRTVQQFGL